MSKYTYTAGPWEQKQGSLAVQTISEPKIKICYTDTFGTSGQEADANARLISAAPEMKDALLHIYRFHARPIIASGLDLEAILKKAGAI